MAFSDPMEQENQEAFVSKRFALPLSVASFLTALWLRTTNAATAFIDGEIQFRLYDDLYHAKRIFHTLSNFPSILEFDPDRGIGGAWVPWPPLWDFSAAALLRTAGVTPDSEQTLLAWLPPLIFSLFVAVAAFALTRTYGVAAGAASALILATPMGLIYQSQLASIDHHFLEGPLVILIALATAHLCGERRPWTGAVLLTIALTGALFTQTAFLLAAAIAAGTLLHLAPRKNQLGFAAGTFFATGTLVAIYASNRPPGYPLSPWFLGVPHAAALFTAALALTLRRLTIDRMPRVASLAVSASAGLVLLLVPQLREAFTRGGAFFGGDRWLATIDEFQPLFVRHGNALVDLLELAPAVLLIPLFLSAREKGAVTERSWLIFAGVYTLLALSGKRFISYAIPLLAVAGAIAIGRLLVSRRKSIFGLAALAIIPPLILTAVLLPRQTGPVDRTGAAFMRASSALRALPPGRVLNVWERGHMINFYGGRSVVIDNFGTMPGGALFESAIGNLLETDPVRLATWCRARGIRYLVLGHPLMHLDSYPSIVRLDPDDYVRFREEIEVQPAATATVWWRLTFDRSGRAIPQFLPRYRDRELVPFPDGLDAPVVSIWEVLP